jgi:pimeloyl-ACP methyl ester carboxylesterase
MENVVIKGGSHGMFVTHKEEINNVLLDFLRR